MTLTTRARLTGATLTALALLAACSKDSGPPGQQRVELSARAISRELSVGVVPLSCSPFQVAGSKFLLLAEQAFRRDCNWAKQEARP